MVDSVLFIGTIIIALTELVKRVWPEAITGALTILIALLVGVLVALFGAMIGVVHVSVAEGLMIALAAVGVHTTASSVNSSKS